MNKTVTQIAIEAADTIADECIDSGYGYGQGQWVNRKEAAVAVLAAIREAAEPLRAAVGPLARDEVFSDGLALAAIRRDIRAALAALDAKE